MSELKGKIDFTLFVSANGANVNGDPLNGNRPRINLDGYGEMSDVCIKRKIRNRLQDLGQKIFVQSDDRATDSYTSLKDRADGCQELKAQMENKKNANRDACAAIACKEWLDVRMFGQVFAFKNVPVSFGVRGPVSIHQAISLSPIDIISMQITKSVNSESGKESKASDTMGMKHRVDFAVYKIMGSVNVQLAEKTGFSQEDAEALKEAGLQREDIDALVTTGYGRTAIKNGDKSITEITCHARGAHFLNPEVRTVIDIGGQDSKVIRLDENGAVANFVMNDKCAAGTGRFLEMMARTMEMNLDQMSECGLEFKEDITISSMCTVFAESEVVSLIAQNKATDDIVHGLNKAVAVKTAALTRRVGGEEKYMMTGGVSKNKGLVKTLEEKLGTKLVISDKAQLCGALGAALFAADMADV